MFRSNTVNESVCACIKKRLDLHTEIEKNTNSLVARVKNDLTCIHQKIKVEKMSQASQCHLETVGQGFLDNDT